MKRSLYIIPMKNSFLTSAARSWTRHMPLMSKGIERLQSASLPTGARIPSTMSMALRKIENLIEIEFV
jgi:hypothetical protein